MHYRTDLFGDADLQAKFEAEVRLPAGAARDDRADEGHGRVLRRRGRRRLRHRSSPARKRRWPAASTSCWSPTAATTSTRTSSRSSTRTPAQMTAQWMKDLYDAGAIPSDTTNLLWPEVAQNFCDGKVAFYLEWYGWYSYFQDPESCKVAGKFDMVRGPRGRSQRQPHRLGRRARLLHPQGRQGEGSRRATDQVPHRRRRSPTKSRKLGLLPVRDDVWARIIADAAASDVPLDKKRLEIAQQQISRGLLHAAAVRRLDLLHQPVVPRSCRASSSATPPSKRA